MATNDCSVVGRSECPCGKGAIVVEHCIPDHPWVRGTRGWYRALLDCEECAEKYEFFHKEQYQKPRLVRRVDGERVRLATKNWHAKLREIEASEAFQNLANKLNKLLASQTSAAAAHRLLVSAKLTRDSVGQFRRRGYRLSALDAAQAMRGLQLSDEHLENLVGHLDDFYEEMKCVPAAVRTGNPGLDE